MKLIKHNDLFGYALSKKRGVIVIKIGKKVNKLPVSYYWSKRKDWSDIEKKALNKIKCCTVLDIGAGVGRYAVYFKNYKLTTTEISPILYNILKKRKLNPLLIDITKNQPQKKYKNILLLDNNIGLTNKTDDFLKRLKKLLTTNGQLIIIANNVAKTKIVKMKMIYKNYYQNIAWTHIKKTDLIKKLLNHGYTIDYLESTNDSYLIVAKN